MPGEFEIIERYFRRGGDATNGVLLGIGDDAAVVEADAPLVVAVDTLVGGVHFPPDLPPEAIGHRALAVNLSDLAAMGAEPRWCTLALTIPAAETEWLEAFARGFFALAERHGTTLIGGDTTRGPLCVTVQALGVAVESQTLTRAGAHVGDDVYVTGSLGASAAAIALWAGAAEPDWSGGLFRRFAFPEPRVAAGRALIGLASAAIDVSDGLVQDLGHVCRASGCAARVQTEHVPLAGGLVDAVGYERGLEFALGGGDDYELCFTAAREHADRIAAACADSGVEARRIGEIVAGEGVSVLRNGSPIAVASPGFNHF